MGLVTSLDAIGTATPPFHATQAEVAEFMLRLPVLSPAVRAKIPRIYAHSGIDSRHSCIADYERLPEDFDFFPRSSSTPAPTTAERNRLYIKWAPGLAEAAAREAMTDAACPPSAITHVIVVTCTGFYNPGIDFHLIRALGLGAGVARTTIGFMGCYAALTGLKTADAICRSTPGARVLMVCVELCTLHFAIEDTLESAVINAIFADGAAAAVLSSVPADEATGKLTMAGSASVIEDDSLDDMTWNIGDAGFLMSLSPRVPDLVARRLPAYVDGLVAGAGLSRADIDFWAIHPGGRQVLDKAADTLGLSCAQMADSYAVLREYGNMSSPTVLFILRRLILPPAPSEAEGESIPAPRRPRTAVAMAFGPGLAIEGCVLSEA